MPSEITKSIAHSAASPPASKPNPMEGSLLPAMGTRAPADPKAQDATTLDLKSATECHRIPEMEPQSIYTPDYANKLAKEDPKSLAFNIRKFNLAPDHRLRLANQLAEKDLSTLARHIDYFKLDEEHLLGFANKAMEQDTFNFCLNVDKFGLSLHQRFEFAQKVAAQDLDLLARTIVNFELNPLQRCQFIAQIFESSSEPPYAFLQDIDFPSMAPRLRFECANIAVKNNLNYLARNIHEFCLKPEHQNTLTAIVYGTVSYLPCDFIDSIDLSSLPENLQLECIRNRISLGLKNRDFVTDFNLKPEQQLMLALETLEAKPDIFSDGDCFGVLSMNTAQQHVFFERLLQEDAFLVSNFLFHILSKLDLDLELLNTLARKCLGSFLPEDAALNKKTLTQDMWKRLISMSQIFLEPEFETVSEPERFYSLIEALMSWRNEEQFVNLVDLIPRMAVELMKVEDSAGEGSVTAVDSKLNDDSTEKVSFKPFLDFNQSLGRHGQLPSLLLWPIVKESWATMKQPERDQFTHFFARRELKDTQLMIPVMSFLTSFGTDQDNKLPVEEAKHLIMTLSKKTEPTALKLNHKQQLKEFIKNLELAKVGIMFNREDAKPKGWLARRKAAAQPPQPKSILELQSLSDIVEDATKRLITLYGLKDSEKTRAKIDEYHQSGRAPTALVSYALTHLHSETSIRDGIRNYAQQVIIDGNFLQKRYDTQLNPHLAQIQETNKSVFDRWAGLDNAERPPPLDETFLTDSLAGQKKSVSVQDYLKTRIIDDRHWAPEQCPILAQVLKGEAKPHDAVQELGPFMASTGTKENAVLEQHLEVSLIKILAVDTQQQLPLLKALCQNVLSNPPVYLEQFKQDLIDLQKQLASPEANTSAKWTVEISDDDQDLLLCGTKIVGSCQRLNGDPRLNRGLLGYLLDGKIKLLALKDSKGLVARQLVRLLIDNQGQPVLHLDRKYENPGVTHQQEQAMSAVIADYAQWLNVDIVSEQDRDRYPLQSLGGPAPYEYADLAGGVQADGKYSVKL